jgi:acetyl esterase/lipase
VDGHDIEADVYRAPGDDVRPAVLWIHGGALIFGSRTNAFDWQLREYLDAGYVLVSIDYRLAPETKIPAIVQDVEDAYSWMRDEGPGLFRIDPDRMAVVGHSAGGYLALVAGSRCVPPPQAVISFYGYGDLTGAWYSSSSEFYSAMPEVSEEEARSAVGDTVITGTPELETVKKRAMFYLFCRQRGLWPREVGGKDPVADRDWFSQYEPLNNISPEYPATLLLHGERDTDVPFEQSVLLAKAFNSHAVEHELVSDPNWGHVFDRTGDDPVVRDAFHNVLRFLGRHLSPRDGAQERRGWVEFVVTVARTDLKDARIYFSMMGGEFGIPVADDASILDDAGEPLKGRLSSPELTDGATVTIRVTDASADTGEGEISTIRVGTHVPEQRRIRGGSVGLTPLTEFGEGETYAGESGGLYGDGSNTPPATQRRAAEAATAAITPLNAEGQPAVDGVIGFVSISMSNATMEFSEFKELADADDRKSPDVMIVDCAQNGMAMAQWVGPNALPWAVAATRMEAAGLSPNQVQVAWLKIANMFPAGDLEYHGRKLYDDTLAVLQNAKTRFPNLRVVYLGSRIFAGLAPEGPGGTLNPEPYAYEGAFVVRRLIRDQIAGDVRLAHTGDDAPTSLLLWGPYLWADGETPREADALTWLRGDLMDDGVHPTESGCEKVADVLLKFLTTDPTAKQWFMPQ